MQITMPKKLLLATVVAAFLVAMTVLFVSTGVRFVGPMPTTGDGTGAPAACSLVDGEQPARRGDASVRVPVSALLEQATRGAVEGTVRDATGATLHGVDITARRLGETRAADGPWSTTTDARGRFTLALPGDASTELAFSCSGYRPHRERVRAPVSDLDVVLERSPTFRGRVVRQDGAPIAGALVHWSDARLPLNAGATTTTGIDGRFAFEDVPWSLDLEVLAPDALPAYRYVVVGWSVRELVVTVDDGRKAKGTVVDAESGQGIAGATVELWYYASTYTAEGRRAGPSQHAETVTTRSDGTFTLTELPSVTDKRRPGGWLWVTAPGHASHWQLVADPERADALRVALYPAGRVRGRVIDASGAPVAGERVWAEAEAQTLCDAGSNRGFRMQDGGYSVLWSTRRPEVVAPFQTAREAFTNAAGAYVIDGIPCPAAGGEVTMAILNGHPRVTAVARPGEVAAAPDLVRPAGLLRRWHGAVHDRDAHPIAGATLEMLNVRTTSDDRGRFELEVPASVQGELTLRASAPGYVPRLRTIVPNHGPFAECDEDGVTITLARAVRLAVLVTDRNQRPVPNASVEFFPAGGLADFATGGPRPTALGHGRSDAQGAVLLEGVPETCDILVELSRDGAPSSRKILEAVAARTNVLRVNLEDLDVSEGTATLTVRVIDGRTNRPFDGRLIVEATSESDTRRRLALDPDTRLEDMPCGTWEVTVAAEGVGTRTERVDLLTDRRIDVRLGEGVEISGQVSCAAGPLTQPVQVSARDLAFKRLSVTRSDVGGHFALPGMEPGEYLLSVEPYESDDFSRWWPRRAPQGYTSPVPVDVRVVAGMAPLPVDLPVVPVAPLKVEVAPAATPEQSMWSWAQGLRFAVTDDHGDSVYADGPTDVTTAGAELRLRVPAGDYTIRVGRCGRFLSERTLRAGESWKLSMP